MMLQPTRNDFASGLQVKSSETLEHKDYSIHSSSLKQSIVIDEDKGNHDNKLKLQQD